MSAAPKRDPRLLSHAGAWTPDPRILDLRERLQSARFHPLHEDDGWGFGLVPRKSPDGLALLLHAVTASDSLPLTSRLLRTLPALRVDGGPCAVILEDPFQNRREMEDEPMIGVLLRVLRYGELVVGSLTAIGAGDLPPGGLLFIGDPRRPPFGWPP